MISSHLQVCADPSNANLPVAFRVTFPEASHKTDYIHLQACNNTQGQSCLHEHFNDTSQFIYSSTPAHFAISVQACQNAMGVQQDSCGEALVLDNSLALQAVSASLKTQLDQANNLAMQIDSICAHITDITSNKLASLTQDANSKAWITRKIQDLHDNSCRAILLSDSLENIIATQPKDTIPVPTQKKGHISVAAYTKAIVFTALGGLGLLQFSYFYWTSIKNYQSLAQIEVQGRIATLDKILPFFDQLQDVRQQYLDSLVLTNVLKQTAGADYKINTGILEYFNSEEMIKKVASYDTTPLLKEMSDNFNNYQKEQTLLIADLLEHYDTVKKSPLPSVTTKLAELKAAYEALQLDPYFHGLTDIAAPSIDSDGDAFYDNSAKDINTPLPAAPDPQKMHEFLALLEPVYMDVYKASGINGRVYAAYDTVANSNRVFQYFRNAISNTKLIQSLESLQSVKSLRTLEREFYFNNRRLLTNRENFLSLSATPTGPAMEQKLRAYIARAEKLKAAGLAVDPQNGHVSLDVNRSRSEYFTGKFMDLSMVFGSTLASAAQTAGTKLKDGANAGSNHALEVWDWYNDTFLEYKTSMRDSLFAFQQTTPNDTKTTPQLDTAPILDKVQVWKQSLVEEKNKANSNVRMQDRLFNTSTIMPLAGLAASITLMSAGADIAANLNLTEEPNNDVIFYQQLGSLIEESNQIRDQYFAVSKQLATVCH